MEWKLALFGFGNVAQGLGRILVRKKEELRRRYGFEFSISAIVTRSRGSIYDESGVDLEAILNSIDENGHFRDLCTSPVDVDAILSQSGVDMIIDTTPTDLVTGEPGLSIIRKALSSGKHVISSSKGPVSVALPELMSLAEEKGLYYRFEGALLSGTPSINLAMEAMAGCDVTRVQGIVNGTTNYILSRMEEGLEYDQALTEAQELGYAEADPAGDVDGWDAAVKAQIMSTVIMDRPVSLEDVSRRGIGDISRSDVEDAVKRGKRIKLIAQVERVNGEVHPSVSPVELPLNHPLAGVMGATNAITYSTDNLRDVTIVGPGAGREETGQALLTDILAVARERSRFIERRIV